MALNLDGVGKPIGPFTKDYTWKDAVLYALGVGAGFSDLDYCYEQKNKILKSSPASASPRCMISWGSWRQPAK